MELVTKVRAPRRAFGLGCGSVNVTPLVPGLSTAA
jgi:hypothetical protein